MQRRIRKKMFYEQRYGRNVLSDFSFEYRSKTKSFVVLYNGRITSRSCVKAILEACESHLGKVSDVRAEWLNSKIDKSEKEEEEQREKEREKRDDMGFVYLCRTKTHRYVKIGFSKYPDVRESTLRGEDPELKMFAKFEGTMKDEKFLHRQFKEKRKRGEWFDLSRKDITAIKRIMIGSLL